MKVEQRQPLAWTVIRFDEVDSTMDVALDLARRGSPAGTIVVTDHQTSGRGQRGRIWLEPPGTCLLFTLILRPTLDVAVDHSLSRQIADRVASAVSLVTGLRPRVKDPNDVMIGTRKLCGILCQTSIRGESVEHLLIGIGLNVNVAAEDLPFDTATSLLVETGSVHDREAILHSILDQLQTIPRLCDGAFLDSCGQD